MLVDCDRLNDPLWLRTHEVDGKQPILKIGPQYLHSVGQNEGTLELAGRTEEAKKSFAEFERKSLAETNIADNSNHELVAYYVDHAHQPGHPLCERQNTLQDANVLKVFRSRPGGGETGQLYVGLSANTVTAGFRIYSGGKRKGSVLAEVGEARVEAHPGWVARQKKRLGRRYESYWYTMEKGAWTKHPGWPLAPRTWM